MIIKNPNYSNEYYGMSTDIKPINALNASRFYEIDTGNVYMFDEEGKQWFKQRGNASDDDASGGTGGVLVANGTYAITDGNPKLVLDKTWQEIYDANFAIVKVDLSATVPSVEVLISIFNVVNFQVVNGTYAITLLGQEPGSSSSAVMPLITDSPDGYPTFVPSSH